MALKFPIRCFPNLINDFVNQVCLAKEAGMSYAAIALATDYDCWKEDNHVSCFKELQRTYL